MYETTEPDSKVKIIDFSKAGRMDAITIDFEKGYLAKAKSMAPEIMEGKRVGFFTDMWSLGVLTYYL